MKLVTPVMVAFLLFTLPYRLFAQSDIRNCRSDWQFFKLKKSITGTVILHKKAVGSCGYFIFSSCTILKTLAGDTIRVIDNCDYKIFVPGDHVRIDTAKRQDYGIVTINKYECIVKKTTVGVVTKIK
ncbi:MAG: hypothetical protein JST50_08190 [Bacteroidetes bacterium]|jgi:predicted RNA-binding protein with TRAM domain|nr:hypothetical protein [Bacteroidota bacterium]